MYLNTIETIGDIIIANTNNEVNTAKECQRLIFAELRIADSFTSAS